MPDPEKYFAVYGRKVCMEKAEEIVHHLKNDGLTPVDSGDLLRGYHAEPEGAGAKVVSDEDYWIYVEYGTRDQDAQPHVGPAIEAARGDF